MNFRQQPLGATRAFPLLSLRQIPSMWMLALAFALSGCANTSTPLGRCVSASDCADGVCINGLCRSTDAAIDAPVDAGTDAPVSEGDAGTDSGTDATDSGPDGGTDAGPGDAGDDAGIDAGPCGGPCTLWRLADGASRWEPVPTTGDAPTTEVHAAFDIESTGNAIVLTETTYHVLDIDAARYTASGRISDFIPSFEGHPSVATSVPAAHSDGENESVMIASGTHVFVYGFSLATGRLNFDRRIAASELGPDWGTPHAPSLGRLDGVWTALEDDERWTNVICPGGARNEIYAAYLSNGRVHVYASGHCFGFMESYAFDAFGPFRNADAPASEDVAASFYHRGDVWVFTR